MPPNSPTTHSDTTFPLAKPIPVSVIIVTKNEERRLPRCLESIKDVFDDIWIVDSASTDQTRAIAKNFGAQIHPYIWNGRYPKKRQYCLDSLPLKYDKVFFLDADEYIPPTLTQEIAALDWSYAGYFIKGCYLWRGHPLKHGLHNNKLALFDRRFIEFPPVDDLDIPGMDEIEGHYQPVLKRDHTHRSLGQIKTPLWHDAMDDFKSWKTRHKRYAAWEAGMNAKNAWPKDPVPMRQKLKQTFRRLPARGLAAFLHSYILKRGFMDGFPGFELARRRALYYRMISDASKAVEKPAVSATPAPAPHK